MSISAKTKLYGLIGNPVEHSISPFLHNTYFKYFNKDRVYLAFNIEKEKLSNFVNSGIEIFGFNVTLPYKKQILDYLDEVDFLAKEINSVNTVKLTDKGYIGYNTDLTGIEETLKKYDEPIKGKVVLILGAGATAYTAAFVAIKGMANEIIIANRTLQNAVKLKSDFKNLEKIQVLTLDEVLNLKTNPHIVINTTSVGFFDKIGESPVKEEFFKLYKPSFVLDMIYSPWETKLLSFAKKYLIKYTNGFYPLIFQGIASQEIWQEALLPEVRNKVFEHILCEYKNIKR